MRNFRKLQTWERAHYLVLSIYKTTSQFPNDELFGLSSQLRRSSASIPTNIAEGCGRSTELDFVRFLDIAMGSASETEYQLQLAHDLGYLTTIQYQNLNNELVECKRMLNSFIQKIRTSQKQSP